MKKLIIIFLLLSAIKSFSQKKDTAQKYDTVAVISFQQAQVLMYYMQQQASGTVDVKPAVWSELIATISKSLQLITKPKK